MSAPSFAELEDAAGAVIRILKTIPEFAAAKIAVIGGLSLWKYIRRYRTTEVSFYTILSYFEKVTNHSLHQDVDFLITIQGAPKAVKDKLFAIHAGSFQQHAQLFYYKGQNGKLIQIDITPDWQVSKINSTLWSYNDVLQVTLSSVSRCSNFEC